MIYITCQQRHKNTIAFKKAKVSDNSLSDQIPLH